MKILKTLGLTALLIICIVVLINMGGQKTDDQIAGLKASIRWEYVNLRENPSTSSEIIQILYRNSTVTLTGEKYEVIGGDGKGNEDNWVQVTTKSGNTGWIVSASAKW